MSDRWTDDDRDGGRYVRNDDLEELGRGGRPPRRQAMNRGAFGQGDGYSPNDTPSRRSRGDYDYDRDPQGFGDRGRDGDHRGHEKRSWFSPDVSDESFNRLYRQGVEGQRNGPPLGADDRYGEHRGKGPKNFRRTDERIMEDLNERLTDDGRLDASDIEVACTGGEVTLNGTVSSKADKRRAEDIADSIGGVGHVQNNLRVAETFR